MTTRRTPLGQRAGFTEAEPVSTSSPQILLPASPPVAPHPVRIYVASSMASGGTPLYHERMSQIRECFPRSTVVEPRLEFDSPHDWSRRRVEVIRSAGSLVFFEDRFGFIGRGVVSDVRTAATLELPTWFLTGDGVFIPYERVSIVLAPDALWDEYAIVSYRLKASE